ncbi:hypothetical protein [Glycomyces paridis]|uniref:Transposase n=1 Tax=Glycomyces paridis TaxID=2126555 RepID=A0A4S8PJ31_9ACTN|nr:hypothetical protein [Glycomyces paridis]THV30680.1 hypothetical protein E9998_04645 [Glycomyces paridis]
MRITQVRRPTSENEGLVGYDAVIAEENRKLRAENERLRQDRATNLSAAGHSPNMAGVSTPDLRRWT